MNKNVQKKEAQMWAQLEEYLIQELDSDTARTILTESQTKAHAFLAASDEPSPTRRATMQDPILPRVATYLALTEAGQAAEELMFGSITTGASNDIEQATKLARGMITRYGMAPAFGMVALETVNNAYLGGDTSLACAPETQREIDKAVIALVGEQRQRAMDLLRAHQAELVKLANYLFERETITGEEFMAILHGSAASAQEAQS